MRPNDSKVLCLLDISCILFHSSLGVDGFTVFSKYVSATHKITGRSRNSSYTRESRKKMYAELKKVKSLLPHTILWFVLTANNKQPPNILPHNCSGSRGLPLSM